MQVKELNIERASSYAPNPGQFVGKVTLSGETGSQEILLSATAISAIFAVIRNEASETAKKNAAATSRSIESASNEPLLLASVGGAGDE